MDAQIEPEAAVPRSARESGRAKNHAFELKGMVAPLTVLHLNTGDTGAIAGQLVAKVAQMPQFFQDAPVLIDLAGLGAEAGRVHFGELAALLRSCKMIPVAITNADAEARTRAAKAGFGFVAAPAPRPGSRPADVAADGAGQRHQPTGASAEPSEPRAAAQSSKRDGVQAPRAQSVAQAAAARSAARAPLVIRQPVRSGQRIYAEGTDIVLLAPVNSGAEVIADGHVHAYSTLRGRAVAGARGMTEARIFCQKLDAELVAIAGAYLLSDDLPAEHRGKAVQIYLENGVCHVAAL